MFSSSSATYPSYFPASDAYAPVYVMRKLAFQPSDVDQGGVSRRNSLRRHATPDFLLASPADREFPPRQFQFSHRGSTVLSSPSPDLPSFHFAPPAWHRTESMDSDYSGENESSLDHLHSSGEEYDGVDMDSTGPDAVLDLFLSSAAGAAPQPRPSPQVSLMRRGSQDSLIGVNGPVRLNRTLPATPRIVHHSLPPAGYTPAPASGSLDTSLFLPGSAKHGRPFETLCVDPFERKKRRVGSTSESTTRFRNEFAEPELIGKGSFSDVFKVRNRIDGHYYAIKRLKKQCSNESEKKACEREASILSLLSHRADQFPDLSCHIIRYYSSWFEEGRLYIQTELCESSVPDLINVAGGSLAEKTIINILRDVSRGLKFLHSMELVHLDIKPANIFQSLPSVAGTCMFKIGDLGLVSPAGEPAEVTSGDARYLPREILLNNYKHLKKADIFSLGATVLECMLGERLEAEGEEWHRLRDGILPTDELIGYSKDLVALVESMLSPDPEKRPVCDDILTHPLIETIHFPPLKFPSSSSSVAEDVSPMSSGYPHDKENAVAKASPGKALMRSLKHTRQKLRKLFTAAT